MTTTLELQAAIDKLNEENGALIAKLDSAADNARLLCDVINRMALRLATAEEINAELDALIRTQTNGGKEYAKFPTTTGE